MIIGVCGFGSTGSGAVMDYLREFDEVSAGKNMELSFLYDPDGVLELENRLVINPIRFYSGDAAIKCFIDLMNSYDLKRYVKRYMPIEKFKGISDKYIKDLIDYTWDGGLWHFDRRRSKIIPYFIKYIIGGKILRVFDKLQMEQPKRFFDHRMYIPIHDDRFYLATKRFTGALINEMCDTSKKIIALDQPFPSNNPQCCFKFFEQKCKAIIVNRDPRDVYLISKKMACGWEMRFTPTHDVEGFITYYRDQMDLIKDLSGDVLFVQFEDLIYNYESETKRIRDFLGLQESSRKKTFFNPSVSIANTQLKLRYPDMKEDISVIERKLKDFLYPFDECKSDLSAKTWVF